MIMKRVFALALSALSSCAFAAGAVPPDYQEPAASQSTTASAVPPDYQPAASADAAGSSAVRDDLKPKADHLSLDEQLQLLKRNEQDIAARKAARQQLQDEAARSAAGAPKGDLEKESRDSSLEFQSKLNKARSRHADDYVKAELEGIREGRLNVPK